MNKILIIDDNKDNLISLEALILERISDAEILTAQDGQSGIGLALSSDPDVVLLDIIMPGWDGFEVCRRIKQDKRISDIPVVFLTALREDKESQIKALDVGAEGFLHKPIDEVELFAQISAMAKIKQAIRAKRHENERLAQLVDDRTKELQKSQNDTLKLVEELKAENESRRKVELELRESEELFHSIFEYHTAVKLIIDPENGKIIDANLAASKFYGWTKEQLKKMKISDINIFSEDDINNFMEMARNRDKEHFEFQHRLADGSIRDVEVFSSQIEIKGKFLLHSIVHDISDRKEAERAILISEVRLKRAEIASKSGNWELHLDTKKIIASEGAMKIYGVERDHLEYEEVKSFPIPGYRQKLDEALKQLIEKDAPYDIEFKIKTEDTGEIKDIHSVAQFNREKQILFGVIQDITERKKVDEALRDSEKQFEQLVEYMQVGVLLHGAKAEILLCNPKSLELLGLNENQLLGKTSYDPDWNVIHEDNSLFPGDQHPVPQAIASRKSVRNVVMGVYRPAKKDRVWLLVDAEPKLNANGTVRQVVCTFIDITERKKAEVALKESEALLRELNATKDKFFTIIAHDLKSPFNSIMGFSNLLIEQLRLKNFNGLEKYATIIQSSSQRAMDLLTNLLEWSRSQTGKMEFNPEYIEMVQLINQTIKLIKDTAAQKSIGIQADMPHTAIVFADRAMVSTILRNLISNAVKFTHPEGKIMVKAEQHQEELLVSVADNGVGIKREVMENLFRIEESYTTVGTKNEKGTGLGLILCKEFIDKHRGKIWAESEPGQGSKFFFTIPVSHLTLVH